MKKTGLFLLACCGLFFSCSKTTKIPVAYTVVNNSGTALTDVYVPDSGAYDLAVRVKFMTGNTTDKVTLKLAGLPADVVAAPDSVSDLPSYTGHFTLSTNHATQATYPVKIVATAPGEDPQVYSFNLNVIPASCASYVAGTYSGSNACTARNYTYTATASAASDGRLIINNFGGYGTNTNMYATLSCAHDSLFIASQDIGNGTTLSGVGTFTSNSVVIYYTATSTPGGFGETCTATLTK